MNEFYQKLSKMHSDELLQILHDCVEILSPVSPAELAEMEGRSKKAILNRINSGKLMYFNFDGRKYPVVNDHL